MGKRVRLDTPCKYCGSRRHRPEICNIKYKAELLVEQGINAFDITIEADSLEDAAQQIADLK